MSDSWSVLRWARGQAPALSPTQAHVLLALASYANPQTGECYPGLATVATATARGEREVTRAFKRLKEAGLIARRNRGPGRTFATYLLAPEVVAGSRPAATQQEEDSRPAADQRLAAHHTQDSRPRTPKTRGGPRPEQTTGTDHKNGTPPAPQRGEVGDLPQRPRGSRSRDHDRYRAELEALADRLFPGVADLETRDRYRVLDNVERAVAQGAKDETSVRDWFDRFGVTQHLLLDSCRGLVNPLAAVLRSGAAVTRTLPASP